MKLISSLTMPSSYTYTFLTIYSFLHPKHAINIKNATNRGFILLKEAITEERTSDHMILCLIRFAKISSYKSIKNSFSFFVNKIPLNKWKLNITFSLWEIGDVQITNAVDASVVTLNPTMKEAIDFHLNLMD